MDIPQASYRAENAFMQLAIDEARLGIYSGHGGPFGSVIVREGQVIASGHNLVLHTYDPTAHGEITTIRRATALLKTPDLTGCDLYTTGEPCPMCLAACLWANIGNIFYGCTIADNERIGFRDNIFNTLLGGRTQVRQKLHQLDRDACLKLFEEYDALGATRY